MTFNTARQFNYYMSCTTADGLHYVATSKDDTILGTMYLRRRTWSEDSMRLYKILTDKFYNIDDSTGLFLDLGANIGTTGIYFLKKFTPKLKLVAFEPDPENFKLLRANLILNDLYEKAIIENFGLGDEETEMTMYRAPLNPGANSLLADDRQEKEMVKIIPLDKYFDDKKFSPKDIKYIWIDTEGFEPQILLGMKNILIDNPAPIFMEFNPQTWNKTGYFDKMMDFLKGLYQGYIWTNEAFQHSTIKIHEIEELFIFKDSKAVTGFVGDIFLIHKLNEVTQ